MKNKFFILIMAVFALAMSARAQVARYDYQSLTVPIVTGGGTSNLTSGNVLGALKQQNVAIALTCTGSTNEVVYFGTSVDGVNYTTNTYSITTTGAGTTVISNFNVAGVGYLRADRVVNTGTINGTNTLVYGIKLNSP
jgi:hypothetical protein